VRDAIVAAAGELLLETGWKAFTIEGVAARAGASKGTIYKWWPSKGALALDGYSAAISDAIAFPVSDDPRADLLAQLIALIDILNSRSGRAIRELIGAAQFDPHLREQLRERYYGPRRQAGIPTMTRVLGPAAGPEEVGTALNAVYGAVFYRLLGDFAPLDEAFAAQLVALVSPSPP
jgi:AcrR family transcriptional regulator